MMSVLTAEFAWPGGDRPGRVTFDHEPPVAVAAAVRRALAPSFPVAAQAGVRLHALQPCDGPVGRYRMSADDGAWFVRVSARWGNPELERSIASHLELHGVPVNPLLVAGRPLEWDGQLLRVDVRPTVDGRHFDGAAGDLARLAESLGACHRALATWPGSPAVQAAAATRNRRLAQVGDVVRDAVRERDFRVFAEHEEWASEHHSWLATMGEMFSPRFDESANAQCLHGEMHPANVLFRADGGAAVLLDFEESVHVFAPPTWDLAFLVQRFCLHDNPAPRVRADRLSVVAEGYGAPLPALARMMRQAAWFSIAVIVDLRMSHGVVSPRDEYDKFVRLEEQGRALEGAL